VPYINFPTKEQGGGGGRTTDLSSHSLRKEVNAELGMLQRAWGSKPEKEKNVVLCPLREDAKKMSRARSKKTYGKEGECQRGPKVRAWGQGLGEETQEIVFWWKSPVGSGRKFPNTMTKVRPGSK